MEKILTFDKIKNHDDMMQCLTILSDRYPNLAITVLGHSIFNREIPMISLGEGSKTVVYIGAFCGTDLISSVILLRFVNEYCEMLKNGRKIYNIQLDHLTQNRKIYIIPMVNPDGINYVTQGVDAKNPFYRRICELSNDHNFSNWKYNGRGVDLRTNFLTPMEPEPEISAVSGLLKFDENIKLVIEFACGKNTIVYSDQNAAVNKSSITRFLGRMSSMALSQKSYLNHSGDLIDYCNQECGISAYSIFVEGNTKNKSKQYNAFHAYSNIREMLFTAPTLI